MKTIQPENYISPIQAHDLHSKGAIIIDVREEFEFSDKGIDLPGVFNFPLKTFKEQCAQIPLQNTIIVACAVGFSSEKAAKILIAQKYKQVFVIQGGILAWSDEGLPMYTHPETLPDELDSHQCNCGCH